MPALNQANQAHHLAAQITAARSRGDVAEANRLVVVFNEHVEASLNQPQSEDAHPAKVQLSTGRYSKNNNPQNVVTPSAPPIINIDPTVSVPKPARPGSLAEAILADKNKQQNEITNSNPITDFRQVNLSSAEPSAQRFTDQSVSQAFAYPPDNLPIDNNVATEFINSYQPHVPEFKELVAQYHDGVQSLLKAYLKKFSTDLEIPEPVLGPSLVKEFERMWRDRQMNEPLLLKLPDHIQQRSVLLRFEADLIERLK